MFKTKVSGIWRNVVLRIKVLSSWKEVVRGSVKVSGTWRTFYKRLVVSNGLLNWWGLDGVRADYITMTSVALSAGASFQSIAGKLALRLVSGGYATTPSIALGSGPWTINLWYYPVSIASYSHLLTHADGQTYFALKLGTTGVFPGRPYLYAQSLGGSQVAATALTMNQWSMVTFTYTAGRLRIYVNGVLSGTFSVTFTVPAGQMRMGVGHNEEASNGYQRDVSLFDRELTQAEITALYNDQL